MKIKPELMEEFEKVFPQAAAVSASCKGYISHEMQRCVETKGKYFYLIRWESVEAHEVDFRQTPNGSSFAISSQNTGPSRRSRSISRRSQGTESRTLSKPFIDRMNGMNRINAQAKTM